MVLRSISLFKTGTQQLEHCRSLRRRSCCSQSARGPPSVAALLAHASKLTRAVMLCALPRSTADRYVREPLHYSESRHARGTRRTQPTGTRTSLLAHIRYSDALSAKASHYRRDPRPGGAALGLQMEGVSRACLPTGSRRGPDAGAD